MPKAISYTPGKPDNAGGPPEGRTETRKPIHAEGLTLCFWEVRPRGRPNDNCNVRYMEADLCRRPYRIHLGSPTMREAHWKDLQRQGSRSMPKALYYVYGKPDHAGGPMIIVIWGTWKPIYAEDHIVYTWEARRWGRPTRRMYRDKEADPPYHKASGIDRLPCLCRSF